MFAQIKSVVDIVTNGFTRLRTFNSKRERESSVTDMLSFYFLLKDCVDDGEALITEAGRTPVSLIKSLGKRDATATISRWDSILRRQGIRLDALQALLFGQTALAVINPELEKSLRKAIGYKMDRVVTLHGIGSVLVLRCMLQLDESDVEKARLIAVMAGEKSGNTVDMQRVRGEIMDLRRSLDKYREQLQKLISNEEILRLSKRARRATLIPREAPKYN